FLACASLSRRGNAPNKQGCHPPFVQPTKTAKMCRNGCRPRSTELKRVGQVSAKTRKRPENRPASIAGSRGCGGILAARRSTIIGVPRDTRSGPARVPCPVPFLGGSHRDRPLHRCRRILTAW